MTISGATIKKVSFNIGTWQSLTSTSGSVNNETHIWTGNANTVTFTNSTSSQAKFKSIVVEYE